MLKKILLSFCLGGAVSQASYSDELLEKMVCTSKAIERSHEKEEVRFVKEYSDYFNKNKSFGEFIPILKGLDFISLRGKGIKRLSDEQISSWAKGLTLDLSDNLLEFLAGTSEILKGSMSTLAIARNKLTNLQEVEELKNLRFLYASQNLIESIGFNIGTLSQLEEVFLDYNQLVCMDYYLTTLNKLKILSLSNNQIQYFSEVEKMESLEILNLSGNPLKNFHNSILSFAEGEAFKILDCRGCPLQTEDSFVEIGEEKIRLVGSKTLSQVFGTRFRF